MGSGVHEGQPQCEHQRCPTTTSCVSSVLVTPGRFRKIPNFLPSTFFWKPPVIMFI